MYDAIQKLQPPQRYSKRRLSDYSTRPKRSRLQSTSILRLDLREFSTGVRPPATDQDRARDCCWESTCIPVPRREVPPNDNNQGKRTATKTTTTTTIPEASSLDRQGTPRHDEAIGNYGSRLDNNILMLCTAFAILSHTSTALWSVLCESWLLPYFRAIHPEAIMCLLFRLTREENFRELGAHHFWVVGSKILNDFWAQDFNQEVQTVAGSTREKSGLKNSWMIFFAFPNFSKKPLTVLHGAAEISHQA